MAKVSCAPQVSVVMSVFNGAANLAETLDSVLAQEGCRFEFVVVNDGSSDGTAEILDDYARKYEQMVVIHQENTGLTRALINGCASATGEFIARQDADDVSMPGRLSEQLQFLLDHPGTVAVASAVRFAAPSGELLFDRAFPDVIEISLDFKHMRVPPLVGAMFRRDVYLKAGGFRAEFSAAQDVDMWLRLVEQGPCRGLPTVHYQTRMTVDGITSRRRGEQFRLGELAVNCARLRREGKSDRALLDEPVTVRFPKRQLGRWEKSRFHYFVASCLRAHDPEAASRYFLIAWRDNPFNLKALLRCVTG